jgi:hypothetical protein
LVFFHVQVEVSDGATVVLTGKGEVVALHQYTVKKLGARQHGIEKIQVCPYIQGEALS